MKEQNFVKLLQSQEIFKQTKLRKKKSKKVMNTVLAVGAIVVLGALAFTKYGKKLPVSSKDIINNL